MNLFLDRYCRFLEGLSALLLAIMVVLVFGNVVLRYVFNSGITISEELSRWMFVWLTFLGAIVALKEHGHLGTDMLVSRLPTWGKKACLVVGQIVMLYVTWLLFSGSLYALALTGERWLGAVAPLGGTAFILAWSAFAWAVLRTP